MSESDYVTLSTENITKEIAILVIEAVKMYSDDDMVSVQQPSGDYLVKADQMRRIMEVNAMAAELLEMMKERGTLKAAADEADTNAK